MVTTLIVWGAIPFVVVTVYAGLAQVPGELVEAAEVDGAKPWRVFRDVTFPILKPIFLILTSLSIIWDFGVFTQPYLLIEQSKLHAGNYLMAIYLFEEGYFKSDFGRGAAISILMLLMVAVLSVFYVRRMVKMGDVGERGGEPPPATARACDAASARRRRRRRGRAGWNVVGIAVFVVMVFPVFWMISTAFKPDDEINRLTPTWLPLDATLAHFRDAIHRDYFWNAVVNSLIIVGVTVGLAMVLAFLAAVALAKFRFTGRKIFIVLMIGIQMLPPAGLIIPLYVVLARYHQTNALVGVIVTYMTFVLPFSVWTLRGFLLGIPRELEEAAMVDGSSRLGAFMRILLPSSRPGSWRRRSSRSSRRGTSTSSPTSCSPTSEADADGLALVLPRDEPAHGLGRPDGGVDADGDPGRRSSSSSCSARSPSG